MWQGRVRGPGLSFQSTPDETLYQQESPKRENCGPKGENCGSKGENCSAIAFLTIGQILVGTTFCWQHIFCWYESLAGNALFWTLSVNCFSHNWIHSGGNSILHIFCWYESLAGNAVFWTLSVQAPFSSSLFCSWPCSCDPLCSHP